GFGSVPDLETIFVIGVDVPAGAVAWKELEQPSEGPPPPPVTWSSADVAFEIYTSGTTGEPKGVRHSHDSMLAEVRSLAAMSPSREAATLGSFPAGHIAGVLSFLRTFVLGTTSVLLDSW